ncbi:salt tolerance receptor-like cytoplasmic kinase 1 [Typha latifolia]|uniref:salt tolerance receptor-like cytoplasmic kinase 1 n=1 Tax=Typha latifolia TaxID=4733 RepID=UPI003C2E031A
MVRKYSFFCCYGGGPNSRVTDEPNPEPKWGPIRQFTWSEIESMTSSFTSSVIGEGGFSTVFLALLPSSCSLAAVKLHRRSDRLRCLFLQELAVLRRISHPHIVSLLGFSDDGAAPAAVFSLVPNGTLHDHLHVTSGAPLTWPRRAAIAFQIAKALEYLHDGCDPQIIHGDIKPSNVLLDANLDAKLCDFGSAVSGFESMVRPGPARQMTGSPGYMDPYYLKTGLVTKKSDVYCFGVLVLELITGVEAVRLDKGRILTAVMRREVGDLVDPRLGTEYDVAEAEAAAEVAAMCVGSNPSLRPSMAEVVRVFEEHAERSISAVDSRSSGQLDL